MSVTCIPHGDVFACANWSCALARWRISDAYFVPPSGRISLWATDATIQVTFCQQCCTFLRCVRAFIYTPLSCTFAGKPRAAWVVLTWQWAALISRRWKVNGRWRLLSPEACSGCSPTACWTLKTHFDRCISSLAVDALQGVDDTRSPKRLRVGLAGTTLSKPAIYTCAPGIKLNNEMQEASTITLQSTRQFIVSFQNFILYHFQGSERWVFEIQEIILFSVIVAPLNEILKIYFMMYLSPKTHGSVCLFQTCSVILPVTHSHALYKSLNLLFSPLPPSLQCTTSLFLQWFHHSVMFIQLHPLKWPYFYSTLPKCWVYLRPHWPEWRRHIGSSNWSICTCMKFILITVMVSKQTMNKMIKK